MRHHAYFYAGDTEKGIELALGFAERELSLPVSGNPDVVVLRYGLFSVEDARIVCQMASRTPVRGSTQLILLAVHRIFHEAQNALLKTFEEPPEGTYLILVVPSEGTLLPTLRSRMLSLPNYGRPTSIEDERPTRSLILGVAEGFVMGGKTEREKVISDILDRAKSDDPDEKQGARVEALALAEGVARAAYAARAKHADPELTALLFDLDRFIPILHERSAPLKPILEHLLLVMPKNLIQ